MSYRERYLANLFRAPGASAGDVLSSGCHGIACRNVRLALRYLDFDVADGDTYDARVAEQVHTFQQREAHPRPDGLVGPGTRDLFVRALTRDSGDRIFHVLAGSGTEIFPTVFVSYAREDCHETKKIVDALLYEGVKIWVDYLNLLPGEKWEDAIGYAIPKARYFLVLLSNHSLSKKGFVQKEVKTAWNVAEQYPDNEIFVIPARLEKCEVKYTKFAALNYIDLFPDIAPGIERIVNSLTDGR